MWNRKEFLRKITWPFVGGLLVAVTAFIIMALFVPSPKEKQLQSKYDAALTEYELLSKQMDGMQEVLNDLEQRDANLYRALLEAEPIPTASRLRGSMDAYYYDSLSWRNHYISKPSPTTRYSDWPKRRK